MAKGQATTLPARSEVPLEQTWDVASVFPSAEAWQAAIEELKGKLTAVAAFEGRLAEGAATLLDCLALAEQAYTLIGKIFVYANGFYSVETTNQQAAAQMGQARSLYSRTQAATAFLEPEIMALGFDTLRGWMAENERLAVYAHFLQRLENQQAHVRSAEVEEVLGLASDALGGASTIYNVLTNADLKFASAKDKQGRKLEVGQSSISDLLTHADRKVRKSAWKSYADGHLAFDNTLANTLISSVKRNVFHMRVKGYASTLEASLAPNKIPLEVFHNLIEVFQKNLPTWHRYWALRRRALGYKKLHVYDIHAPLAQETRHIPFEQAVAWICAGLRPLGEEYVGILRRGTLEQRWVDYSVNRGKRAGAFSSGVQGTHPFIMMSYAGNIFSLSTLAHELGHSLHSYHTWQNQPPVYSDYALFVAEVASNFNQAMTRAHLLETQTDPNFQISILEEAMANFHRYFFIMPTLARFELEIHQRVERDEPLNADMLIHLMATLFQEGYGEEVEIDHDRTGITWAQFGHMYQDYYVYQYATGISGAHALADGILARKEGAVEAYLRFLEAGGSLYPLDALQLAGVDLTTPAPVEKTFEVLSGMVGRLEALAG